MGFILLLRKLMLSVVSWLRQEICSNFNRKGILIVLIASFRNNIAALSGLDTLPDKTDTHWFLANMQNNQRWNIAILRYYHPRNHTWYNAYVEYVVTTFLSIHRLLNAVHSKLTLLCYWPINLGKTSWGIKILDVNAYVRNVVPVIL